MQQFRFVEVPPATARNKSAQEEYWRRVRVEEAHSNAKMSGKKVDLEAHFAQFPQGEILKPVAPAGIDPNLNSQKINQGLALETTNV